MAEEPISNVVLTGVEKIAMEKAEQAAGKLASQGSFLISQTQDYASQASAAFKQVSSLTGLANNNSALNVTPMNLLQNAVNGIVGNITDAISDVTSGIFDGIFGSVNSEDEIKKKSKIYKYKPQFFFHLPSDEKPTELSQYADFTTIYYHFTECTLPFFNVKLILPKDILLKLQRNSDKVTFMVKINKYDPEDGEIVKQRVNLYDGVSLVAVDMPKEFVEPRDLDTTEKDSKNIAEKLPQYPLNLFLFKKDHLFFNKKLNSMVLSETTLQNAVLYLIQKNFTNTNMKFYVGTMDNTKQYKQIIIPPLSFFEAVRYLQKTYGLYNNGLAIFFDFKCGYIMDQTKFVDDPKDPKVTATKVIIELHTIKNAPISSYSSSNLTYYDEENNVYIVRCSNPPKITRPANSFNEMYGEAVKIGSTNSSEKRVLNCVDMTFGLASKNDDRRTKDSVLINPYSNRMLESEYAATLALNKMTIELNFHGGDLEVFTLNRQYEIIDKTGGQYGKDINGIFKIIDARILINQVPGDGKASAAIVATFKKISVTH